MIAVQQFFEDAYAHTDRYWWRVGHVYSTDPDDHAASLMTQEILRFAWSRGPGRVLDLGSGEGADAIRLALMGWDVVAVEPSAAGVRKIVDFAAAAGVNIKVVRSDIMSFGCNDVFDLVICNGVLHYVDSKTDACRIMQKVTAPQGANAVSLWSSFTPVPDCHQIVPTYPDAERGEVVSAYSAWPKVLLYFERGRVDYSHVDMPVHAHSYIKMFALKAEGEV